MTSKFGDYYDHISDTIKNVLIIYIIYMKAKPKYKNEIFLLILLFIILSFYHMSLQELVYNENFKLDYANDILTLFDD